MPAESNYPPVDIPEVGLWDFLFARKELLFPEDKSERPVICVHNWMLTLCLRDLHRCQLETIVHFCPSQGHRDRIRSSVVRSMGLAER
jgi:hypothetical protein